MKNIVGQVVQGNDFYPRPRELKRIHLGLESGSHLLLAAPRRVGKTSLLYKLHDLDIPNTHFIYVITESVQTSNGFFERLYQALSGERDGGLRRVSRKTGDWLGGLFGRVKGGEIAGVGVQLDSASKVNWADKFEKLISGLPLENERLVFLVDEFPQTVENIEENAGKQEAVNFLQRNRELRQNPLLNKKLCFLYTGSIGLEHVVTRLGHNQLINDLNPIEMQPLKQEEALEMLSSLTRNLPFNLTDEAATHLVVRISWLIPFFLQIIVQEIHNLHIDEDFETACVAVVDTAFQKALGRDMHFRHWSSRLQKAFKGPELRYARSLLSEIVEKETLRKSQAFDLAVKHQCEERQAFILNTLIHDGYLLRDGDILRFASPLLQQWWREAF